MTSADCVGLMCTKLKRHMPELMLLYRHPVGPGMTTGLRSFNNPHVVDSFAAGVSVTAPD